MPASLAGNFGFPSGHTLSAFVIYGTLFSAIESLTRVQKLAIGVGVIGTVSVSRVVLGVHYPGDVLGGWVFGVVILGLYLGVARLAVTRTIAIALGLSVPMVLYNGALEELLFGLGGFIGVAAAWWLMGTDYRFDLRSLAGLAKTALGIGLVLVLVGGFETLGAPVFPAALLVGFLAGAYPDLVRMGTERVTTWSAGDESPAVGGR
ncbi:MAG: phosphatase PAP2 family protein [Natrialbaceae archaeon]|nr:phosphatase PAP2 family protein [Natrialbaceae archaeon]